MITTHLIKNALECLLINVFRWPHNNVCWSEKITQTTHTVHKWSDLAK